MKDRPMISEMPEIDQKAKMGSFHYGRGDIPAGVELDQQSPAKDRLLWVHLTRENLLARGDLLENTRDTLQRICHVADLTRILMREHLQN